MSGFVLNIFPPGSLDSSVVTTVWIGILVLAFFNLRLGWVASGFIVPGYLVPLIILKPWSAGVIVIEGVVTYWLVWILSEQFSRWRVWNNFFGRDRFFAILLCSVIVRVLFDGWLLPLLGEYLNTTWHLAFDYRNNLHSFGLVIIALIANQFWKPGLLKGAIPFVVTIFTTWLIVRFGLIEFTNFTISSIGYMYEDLASNILASPKAYIILLTTAYIASRMNLRYGWEFSGILIPSLMTLLWYSPGRIVTTFIEAVIVSLLARIILKAPLFGSFTMEGTRRLVFYFTISYAYKFALSYVMIWLAPEYKVTDAYGFGYLLPTLLAVKMPEVDSYGKTIRVTLQTSVVAIAVASAIGFSLTLVPDLLPGRASLADNGQGAMTLAPDVRLLDRLRADKLIIYQSRLPGVLVAPLPRDIDIFTRAVQMLLKSAETGDIPLRNEAGRLLAEAGYGMTFVENRYLYLSETKGNHGWGIYVLDTRARGNLLVEVPAPLNEQGSLEAGAAIFLTSGARALAIPGYDASSGKGAVPDVSRSAATIFHAFHRAVARRDVLSVRVYTYESVRAIAGKRAEADAIASPDPESTLWVKESLPPGLDPALLRESLGALRINWNASPLPNIQRNATAQGFAELFLNSDDLRSIIFKPLLAAYGADRRDQHARITGYLQDWLLRSKDEIAGPGTDRYVRPKLEELLLLDSEVLTPLIVLARSAWSSADRPSGGMEELRPVQAAAALFGYGVTVYRHLPTGQEYFIVAERAGQVRRRYWGTYVLRIGRADNYLVQVPRPLFEVNSFEYGVNLFERLNARALLIGGAHPSTNLDGSADLLSGANKECLFNLVNQVVLRESHESLMVIQSRAFGLKPDRPVPTAGALVAFSNGAITPTALPKGGRKLVEVLNQDRMTPRFVDGARDVVGYEVGAIPQSLYLNETLGKEFAVIWLSPTTRTTYRQQTENRRLETQFRSLGIPTSEQDLYSAVSSAGPGVSRPLPAELRSRLLTYLSGQDVVVLHSIKGGWPGYRFSRVIDINTKQAFMLVSAPDGRLSAVANLNPRRPLQTITVSGAVLERDEVASFVDTRTALLESGGRR
jgi:hypothetical protein